MFDIAWSEFLVVAVVALVVVGPRDLPALLRTVGKTVASLRRMAGEFQGQFNEAMREAELDGLKNEITGLKDGVGKMVGASPFQIARDELKNALTDKPKPAPSALAGEAPSGEAAEAPSALAPVPEIAPVDEPPAPKPGEFAARRKEAAATEKSALKPKSGANLAPRPKAAPSAKSAAAAPAPKSIPKPRTASKAKSVNGSAHPASEADEAKVPKSTAKSRKPGVSA